jgi:exodeoxyribonuclease III
MKIATWNVNSIKARLPIVLGWLKDARPDVALLQELKCATEAFPALEIEDLGYNLAVHGQKTYNGVAILSKAPIEDVNRGLPGDDNDPQARYIDAFIAGVRVASIYLPNGNPAPGEKFAYKLAWMDRLTAHAKTLLAAEETLALGGDYNVCPTDDDVHDPEAFARDALCRPESRAKYRALLNLGLWDACRALHPDAKHAYTYWDYQQRSFQLDRGLRIDHFLLSPQAADRLTSYAVDRKPRAQPQASDHTPVIITLKD